MKWVIMIEPEGDPPRWFKNLNGFMPPTFADSPETARKFDTREAAMEYVGKLKKAAEREGSETTAITAVEYGVEAPAAPEKNAVRSKLYIEGWGEPRGSFVFGEKCALYLYMQKSKDGLMYAYTADGRVFEAMASDGEAVINAMCKTAAKKAVGLVKAFEKGKRRE